MVYPSMIEFNLLLKIATAAQDFCEGLQENADGVPEKELEELHSALDAWEKDYMDDAGTSWGPGGPRERGA